VILHIIKKGKWKEVNKIGVYENESLKTEGFIHCSNENQVCKVADKHYKGEKGLIVLYIDEKKLNAKVMFEDLYKLDEDYPHIYGPLNTDAVVKTADFILDTNGNFHL
jgi:uncharacterized protein (DUF952 family)